MKIEIATFFITSQQKNCQIAFNFVNNNLLHNWRDLKDLRAIILMDHPFSAYKNLYVKLTFREMQQCTAKHSNKKQPRHDMG